MRMTDAHEERVSRHKAEQGLKLSARSMSLMVVERLFLQEHFYRFASHKFA